MERSTQRNGLINLFALLAIGLCALAVSFYSKLLTGQVTNYLLGLGFLITAVSWFQMRLEEREQLEKLEFDEVTKAGTGAALFQTQESETFPARRSREQFERFFVPGFTLLLCLLQGGGAWWFWQWLDKMVVVELKQTLVALGFYAVFFLILFLIGKYSAGVARLENLRLLRPGADALLLGAYLCAASAGTLIATLAEFERVDLYVARALCLLLAVLALENLLTVILEVYRPRIKGKVPRLLYESRFIGLLSHPEGVFTTAAHALDYQFGFKVSETWFYQFLRRAAVWLFLAQLAILFFSTCFVFIEAGEEALLERFGRSVAGRDVLGPGLHFKLPWPVDQVRRFRTDQIQSFNLGFVPDEKLEQEPTVLWTVAHYKEEHNLLVANRTPFAGAVTNLLAGKKSPPVSLLSVSLPVQYQISDLRAWAYRYRDAAQLLERIAMSEVVRHLVSADFNEIMSRGRFEAAQTLRERIQVRADELGLGAKILFVGLQGIHPPVKIAASFEDVVRARQKQQATLLDAAAYQARTNALAGADAFKKVKQAEAERQRVTVDAQARAALFTNQLPAFKAAPTVYQQRAYLLTLARGSAGARKIVLGSTNTEDVIQLNLEERFRRELWEIPLPTTATPKTK
jgi:regulator of protease activity HflC (stomatin/prohibitin superfamily)